MSEQLTSKRNLFMAGFLLLFVLGIFGVLGTLSIIRLIKDFENGLPFLKFNFIMSLMLFSFIIYSIFYYLSITPIYKISKEYIEVTKIFQSKKYYWCDIKKIILTGKQPAKFLFITRPAEATIIVLNNDSELILWVDSYRNKSDLRVVLNRANLILQSNKDFSLLDCKISKKNIIYKNIDIRGEDFSDDHFFTFNGLLLYGWIFFIGILIIANSQTLQTNLWASIIITFITISFAGILGYQMHYFIITDKYLVIKNTLWFWRKDIYALADINEVVIERLGNLPKSLRIITNDYHDQFYPAGSLKKQTWQDLEKKFKDDSIKIRKTCI